MLVEEAVSMVQDELDRGEKSKRAPIAMHFSDYEITEPIPKPKLPIVFKCVKDQPMQQFIEGLLSLMERHESPLHITLDVMCAFFMEETLDDIKAGVECLSAAAVESGKHRLTFSTCRFPPDQERFWPELGDMNAFLRRHTAAIGEQPLSCHKVFLCPQGDQLATFAQMYEEFFSKTSLGRTPTDAAINITVHWLKMHHEKAYLKARQPSELKKHPHLPPPLPLGLTTEYINDKYMTAILKSRGMFRARRTRSAARRGGQRRGSHRTISRERSDSMVSGARPRGGRSPNSVGALERLLNRVAREGRTSSRDPHAKERESARITGQVAQLYKSKCEEVAQLSVELEALRLEMELIKESKDVKMEAELLKLQKENSYFRNMQDHFDKHSARLGKLKDSLVYENKQLSEELQLLKLSKRERRAARKQMKRRKYE